MERVSNGLSNVMGYVHTFPDEFGNMVDPPVPQKVDCFGNTYFDEVGMPNGHPDTVPIWQVLIRRP